ncbi:MAG: TIGR03088 family PEP-CTERM/XrtA system glycosyltransferase [Rhodocyclaceae bacterium]|nr:TIGR03088 family PEP-CTERM/XrtA system glycosyltransferase [Rhodocyclaceae bacterium]MBX3667307.1 TIGR03088 family PEP-CTERM/XrtA system glycosyltransferase [Rhodocyclaceae bacterium]
MKNADPPLVLHVIHHLAMGGMENGLVNLINNMPPERYRHAICCVENSSDFARRIRRPEVQVHALHRSRIGVWKLRHELYRLCLALRPTIVHTRNQSGLDALVPARFAGIRRTVHGEHGWDVDNLDGSKRKPALLRRLHSPFVDRYITVSRHLEHYLVQRVGIAPGRITQIYNGVDTERFHPAQTPQHVGLPAHLQGSDVVLLGTVGRAQAVKDQATLLRAVALLVERQPELRARVRVAVVGDGPLFEELGALVDSLGIRELSWLPGASDQVPDILRMFDVFVLPSLNEGIANTILEAMASGLPVVATAAGGNPELVQDGHTGRLFAPRDVEALAGLLSAYVTDATLRRAHGANARQTAENTYSMRAMVTRYADVYDGLCKA